MALSAQFPGIIENGLASIGAQPVFYASMEGHHSLDKSAGLLGLGRKSLRRIPVNERLQLNVQQLEATIKEDLESGKKPFCIVATAGTTSSGAIAEISRIHEICRRYNICLHVDSAYGAAVLFSNRHRALVRGIEHADSVTFDPHKWLAMPFSAVLPLYPVVPGFKRGFFLALPYLQQTPSGTFPDKPNN